LKDNWRPATAGNKTQQCHGFAENLLGMNLAYPNILQALQQLQGKLRSAAVLECYSDLTQMTRFADEVNPLAVCGYLAFLLILFNFLYVIKVNPVASMTRLVHCIIDF
jgi:hypothetical protein